MELSTVAQAWVNLILVWVGFGTIVGFVATMFLPEMKHPGFLGNLVIGIMGSCAGPIAFVLWFKPEHFHPMSPVGFAVAVFASVVLLSLYRGFLLVAGGGQKKSKG
ncbi:MAG: hypothetical protein FWE95_09665 [Planctomycetaceae bacterium]|nr:hypothetical protein [Planctomycetaceae bacterium]